MISVSTVIFGVFTLVYFSRVQLRNTSGMKMSVVRGSRRFPTRCKLSGSAINGPFGDKVELRRTKLGIKIPPLPDVYSGLNGSLCSTTTGTSTSPSSVENLSEDGISELCRGGTCATTTYPFLP